MFYKALQLFSGAAHFIYGILALLDPFVNIGNLCVKRGFLNLEF